MSVPNLAEIHSILSFPQGKFENNVIIGQRDLDLDRSTPSHFQTCLGTNVGV